MPAGINTGRETLTKGIKEEEVWRKKERERERAVKWGERVSSFYIIQSIVFWIRTLSLDD